MKFVTNSILIFYPELYINYRVVINLIVLFGLVIEYDSWKYFIFLEYITTLI